MQDDFSDGVECFLDSVLIDNFRKAINSSSIFTNSEKHKHRYNLTCAVMDRIDSAIKVLNSFHKVPKSEEKLVYFLVYACILKDSFASSTNSRTTGSNTNKTRLKIRIKFPTSDK